MKYTLFSCIYLLLLGASLPLSAQTLPLTSLTNLPGTLDESSGMALDGSNSIWTHNDSGGQNALYEVDTLGNLLRTLTISNATNVDWEELTQDDQGNFYIGDFGNNANARTNLRIYKIPHPNSIVGDSVMAEILTFSYANQTAFPPASNQLHFDMESMIWYQGSLYLFSKNRTNPFDGYTYRYQLPDTAGNYSLSPIDSFYTGPGPKELYWVVSADISPSGQQLVLLSYNKLWLFSCFSGDDFFGGDVQQLNFVSLAQYEAVAFRAEQTLYLTSETSPSGVATLFRAELAPFSALPQVNLGPDIATATSTPIQLSAGNTLGLSVLWSTGDTTSGITVSQSGTYSVRLSKGNCLATDTITVDFVCQNFSSSASVGNISCFGAQNGTVDLTLTGGTQGYSYVWSNGAQTEDLSGLAAGTYSVLISDANGCQLSDTFSILEPNPITAVVISQTTTLCPGLTTGFIDMSFSGGTPPYTYSWSNGASTIDLQNLGIGTYTLTITDANACKDTTMVTIPPGSPIQLNAQVSDVLCFMEHTGAIDLSPSGGSAPYTYTWSNGLSSQDLTQVPAGSYTVTVNDNSQCGQTMTFLVGQATPIGFGLTPVPPSCFGQANGRLDLMVAGGVPPYQFSWSNGDTSQNLLNIPAGMYVFVLTDANGCERTDSAQLSQPPAPVYALQGTDLLCFGDSSGTAAVDLSAGGGPYQYLWETGDTTATVGGLTMGTYTVALTALDGCIYEDSVSLAAPPPLLVDFIIVADTVNQVSKGSAAVLVSGGTPPYAFSWNFGGTDSLALDLITGTYWLTLTDANGCTYQDSVFVPAVMLERLENLSTLNRFRLSPNPTRRMISLSLQWDQAQTVTLILWTLTGQKRREERFAPALEHQTSWDLGTLSDGIYLLEIQTPTGRRFERVVLQR